MIPKPKESCQECECYDYLQHITSVLVCFIISLFIRTAKAGVAYRLGRVLNELLVLNFENAIDKWEDTAMGHHHHNCFRIFLVDTVQQVADEADRFHIQIVQRLIYEEEP